MSTRRTPFKMLYQPVPAFQMTSKNTVLLISDMQNLIVDVNGGMAKLASLKGISSEFKEFFESLKGAVENIELLLEKCQQYGLKVIFTRIISKKGNATDIGPHTSIWDESFPYNSDDASLFFPAKKDDLILDKTCNNPFNCTNLENLLLSLKTEYIIICGVRTPGYLNAIAFDAADKGFGVVLVSNASVGGVPGGTRGLTGGLLRIRNTKQVLEMLENIER